MDIDESNHQSGGPCTAIVGNGQFKGIGPDPVIMTADTLNDNSVLGLDDERLGKIDHIMLDVPHGQVAYVVLLFRGFLGVGMKLFVIPQSILMLDTVRKRFVLGIDRRQLGTAPDFSQNHWSSMADT